MPKQTLPLTDSQCKKLQPPNQLSDGGGLYLQARGNGKYWRFRYYRPSDNKRDEMRLGVYPEISLKEAREKREELRGLIAKGIDPKLHQQDKAQRQAEQLKNTFEAIARKWHSDQVAKPNKWKNDRENITNKELAELKKAAAIILAMTETDIEQAKSNGTFTEIQP